MKEKYVREHYHKSVRKRRKKERESRKARERGRERESTSRIQKQQRIWTLNRSPHGNKTAREQFGRQIWQRTVVLKQKEGGILKRTKRIRERERPVKRKQTEISEDKL